MRQAAEILMHILNGIDSCLYVSDIETDEILFVNQKMMDNFGIKTDVTGQKCWKVFQNSFSTRCEFCPVYKLAETPDVPVVWEEHNTLNGRYYKNTDRIIDWVEGKRVHLQNSVDITDIKMAEMKLVHMSAIVEQSPQYISYINKQGEFTFVNPASCDITGYTENELLTGGIALLHDSETLQRIKEEIFPATYSRGSYNFEIPLIRKNGETRIMSFSSFIVGDAEFNFASIARDVTERTQLEQDLLREKEAAEQANKSKTEFLSRMSHEIRTPMNAIIGMTKIASGSDDPEKKKYCLDKIDSASKHLLGILNDVLDMSKIEASKMQIINEIFLFEKMMSDSIDVVNFLLNEKKQELIIRMDSNIPPYIISDEMRLKQVITNILSNAIKFTGENGRIKLSVHMTKLSGKALNLLFEIEDTGIGLLPEQKERIFDSFEQAEETITRKYGGTGLGLTICKHIINLMGGDIWVDSELGKGSKFSFTIKAEQGMQTQRKIDYKPLDKIKILAVDDSADTREYFLQIISSFNIYCDVADSGAQALDMIRDLQSVGDMYNIIFVDWKMPGMNGIELTRRIREDINQSTIIIMISISEWQEVEREATAVGVNKFIPKPLLPSVLMNAINEAAGAPPEPYVAREKNKSYDFGGAKLLLAEDVPINREIIYSLLEDTGIAIESAETGVQAVEMYQNSGGKYDMILMDIHMPGMTGYEATEKIRETDEDIPILAMTANAFREDIEKCRQAGMNDHIAKPLDPDDLRDKIARHLHIAASSPKKAAVGAAPDYADYLPVIDINAGIQRVLGNKKLYLSLLKSCRIGIISAELNEAVGEKDYDKAASSAHMIKGVAANLSLTELYKAAADLEMNIRTGAPSAEMISTFAHASAAAESAIARLLEMEGVVLNG